MDNENDYFANVALCLQVSVRKRRNKTNKKNYCSSLDRANMTHT